MDDLDFKKILSWILSWLFELVSKLDSQLGSNGLEWQVIKLSRLALVKMVKPMHWRWRKFTHSELVSGRVDVQAVQVN